MQAIKTDECDRTRLEIALQALLQFLEHCGCGLRYARTFRRERLELVRAVLADPAAEESDASRETRH